MVFHNNQAEPMQHQADRCLRQQHQAAPMQHQAAPMQYQTLDSFSLRNRYALRHLLRRRRNRIVFQRSRRQDILYFRQSRHQL